MSSYGDKESFSPFERVNQSYLPVAFQTDLDTLTILRAGRELFARARQDKNKCFGYYPDLANREDMGIETNLPASATFAERYPALSVHNRNFKFSFLRYSLIPQPALDGLHIDSNASTGLSFDDVAIPIEPPVLAWRAIVNLGFRKRIINYSDQAIYTARPIADNGFVRFAPHPSSIHTVDLPRRDISVVSGMYFCASRVIHGGADGESGHFVASYGYEEPA